jgi:hypothetical protein
VNAVLANLAIDPGMILIGIGGALLVAVLAAFAAGRLATGLVGGRGRGSSWLPIGIALLVFLVFGMGFTPPGSNGLLIAAAVAFAAALGVAVLQRALLPDDWLPAEEPELPGPP